MELLVLDRHSLQVKDYFFIDKNYDINIDLVIPQKSSFNISRESMNARVGDIITFKDNEIDYIGVVDTIEHEAFFVHKILSFDFIQIFNIELSIKSYSGNIGVFIENIIRDNFIDCSDYYQSLPYLNIINNSTVSGDLTFEVDKLVKVSSLFETVFKNYAVVLKHKLVYLRGRIIGLDLEIYNSTNQRIIKNNPALIQNLIVKKNSTQSTNKIIFLPNSENSIYINPIEFFLLKDNTVTNDSSHELRYEIPRIKTVMFKDDEYLSLDVKAMQDLTSSMYDHNISFDMDKNNQLIVPIEDFSIGDFISFIDGVTTYITIVTGIKYRNTSKIVNVTLGEYRSKLTEKISLLTKSIESSSSSSNNIISNENIDGGEY